jgi:hypothetical protein
VLERCTCAVKKFYAAFDRNTLNERTLGAHSRRFICLGEARPGAVVLDVVAGGAHPQSDGTLLSLLHNGFHDEPEHARGGQGHPAQQGCAGARRRAPQRPRCCREGEPSARHAPRPPAAAAAPPGTKRRSRARRRALPPGRLLAALPPVRGPAEDTPLELSGAPRGRFLVPRAAASAHGRPAGVGAARGTPARGSGARADRRRACGWLGFAWAPAGCLCRSTARPHAPQPHQIAPRRAGVAHARIAPRRRTLRAP